MPPTARSDQRALLWIALVLLVISLALPIFAQTMLLLPYIPMFFAVLAAFVSLLTLQFGPGTALAPCVVCFLFIPFLAYHRGGPIILRVVQWLGICGLLSAWALPVILAIGARANTGYSQSLQIGYYLFALAHTLAFVGCVIGLYADHRVRRQIGFPVVLPEQKSYDQKLWMKTRQ